MEPKLFNFFFTGTIYYKSFMDIRMVIICIPLVLNEKTFGTMRFG